MPFFQNNMCRRNFIWQLQNSSSIFGCVVCLRLVLWLSWTHQPRPHQIKTESDYITVNPNANKIVFHWIMTASNINTVYTDYLMSLCLSICQERPVLLKSWKEEWKGMEWVGAVNAKRAGIGKACSLHFYPTHSLGLIISPESPANLTLGTWLACWIPSI